MDSRSRKALQPIWGILPPGFEGEEYDDFVNYKLPEGYDARVLRVVGPGRHLVVFSYEAGALDSRRSHRGYRLLFLHEDGRLVPFDPKAVEAAWTPKSSHQPYFPWDQEVGKWLAANGARSFRGTNWVGDISSRLPSLLRTWRREHSGVWFDPSDV